MRKSPLSILSIIAVHNEPTYLSVLLPFLSEQDIDVVIIDHGSNEKTAATIRQFSPKPVIETIWMPFSGVFSLTAQLEMKQAISERYTHDWIVHQDVDEILQGSRPGEDLRDCIVGADDEGATAINFNEFVFLPQKEEDFGDRDYYRSMLHYYFFEPRENRLNRVWKRSLNAHGRDSGGHTLIGDGIVFSSTNQVLRHYPVLSQRHARSKYLGRRFDEDDLKKNWHSNRIGITSADLELPGPDPRIQSLSHWGERPLRTSRVTKLHYWQWC